jgi:phospholipase C
MPEGVFNPNLHIYDQRTLYDELQQAGISWRFYYGDIPQSLVLTHQLSYLDLYRKWDRWEPDLAAGDLPDYVFIEPTYFGPGENDQHPPHDVLRGDALIAQVYNGLLSRPDLFANTLLIVLYDEHGGFYDHVPPPPTVPPDQYTQSFGFNVLGPRVPTLLISPLLDPGVTHTVFDHTSLLKLASELWGVAPLGARTAQSHSVLSAIRLRPTPRTDLFPAPAPQVVQAVADQPLLDGRKQSLFDFTHYLESLLPDGEPKRQLMARAHEEMGGAFAQAKLATDRLDAFMQANTRPGSTGRV